jgi:hypothetical protein
MGPALKARQRRIIARLYCIVDMIMLNLQFSIAELANNTIAYNTIDPI